MEARRIDHINIRIPEEGIEEAVEFYHGVLGFQPEMLEDYRNGDRTSFFFRLGPSSVINVRPKPDFERPSGKNLDHFCVLVEADIEKIKQLLDRNDIEIMREGTPLGSEGRSPAFYIEDPFGYVLEIKAGKKNS